LNLSERNPSITAVLGRLYGWAFPAKPQLKLHPPVGQYVFDFEDLFTRSIVRKFWEFPETRPQAIGTSLGHPDLVFLVIAAGPQTHNW
jgi:hypothetical protein